MEKRFSTPATVHISYRVCHMRPSIILKNDGRVLQKVLAIPSQRWFQVMLKKDGNNVHVFAVGYGMVKMMP